MKQSAGTLLYRDGLQGLEVLLVHPSGAYNRRAPWGIPKGEPDEDEADLEATARRETLEETDTASWEVDQARFVAIEEARTIMHPEQAVFLDRLLGYLEENPR